MKLRTLGALRLEGASLTRPKPLLKLAYLALNGPTTRRELADVFFRDADDPRDSLSTSLRHLRKAEVVDLLPDDRIASRVPCDATDLLADFDAYRYEAVLAAYDGPFLDGLDVELGVDLEDWLFATREAIARRVRSAALHRARAALAEGRLEDARQLALHAVSLRDAPELEMDELASALPVLEKLGMPEAAQLRELADGYGLDLERPRVERRAEPRTAVAEAPHRNTPFFGRETELRALDDLLRDPTQRLVTLFGMGGVGKTRLAARLAERLTAREPDRFRDGVAVVPLESVPHPSGVVPAIAARLALPAAAGASAAALADALAGWQALLVLDNFEHVLPAVDDLALLLRAAPNVRFLVTSRARLGLAEERTVELAGLATARDGAQPSDAARLFLERAERVGFPPEAAARDLNLIEALCADLEGYPLGIELAASMTRALAVVDIRTSLADALDVLDHGPVDAPERHRAVRSVFEPTWALLGELASATFCCAERLPRRFPVRRRGGRRRGFATAFAQLVDHALVRSDGSGRGRFGFHPLCARSYGSGRTRRRRGGRGAPTLLRDAARIRGQRVAARTARGARSPRSSTCPTPCTRSGPLQAKRSTPAIAMASALIVDVDFLQARGGGRELIELTRAVADRAAAGGDVSTAERLWTKAANATRTVLGDSGEAIWMYERALALAVEGGEVPRQVMLHSILGALLHGRAPHESSTHFARAELLAGDDPLLRCEVLQRTAHVALLRGDAASAKELNAHAVEIAERLHRSEGVDRSRVASLLFFSLCNLGTSLDDLGEIESSLVPRRRALELALERGNALWVAYAREDLAIPLRSLGANDEARRHAEEAARLFDRQGAQMERARTLSFLAALEEGVEPAPSR
jgi:tetratricopeptide (TPR) repeat protein